MGYSGDGFNCTGMVMFHVLTQVEIVLGKFIFNF